MAWKAARAARNRRGTRHERHKRHETDVESGTSGKKLTRNAARVAQAARHRRGKRHERHETGAERSTRGTKPTWKVARAARNRRGTRHDRQFINPKIHMQQRLWSETAEYVDNDVDVDIFSCRNTTPSKTSPINQPYSTQDLKFYYIQMSQLQLTERVDDLCRFYA